MYHEKMGGKVKEIRMGISATLNLENYESVRIECHVLTEVEEGKVDSVIESLKADITNTLEDMKNHFLTTRVMHK